MWYLISFVVYKLVWRRNGLTDQMIILRYFLKKTERQKSIQRALWLPLILMEILYDTSNRQRSVILFSERVYTMLPQ